MPPSSGQPSIGAPSGSGNGPLIRLVGVFRRLEVHLRLVRRHEDETHVEVVGQLLVLADLGDHLVGIRVNGELADVLVPRIVFGEDLHGGENGVGLRRVEEDRRGDLRHRRQGAALVVDGGAVVGRRGGRAQADQGGEKEGAAGQAGRHGAGLHIRESNRGHSAAWRRGAFIGGLRQGPVRHLAHGLADT